MRSRHAAQEAARVSLVRRERRQASRTTSRVSTPGGSRAPHSGDLPSPSAQRSLSMLGRVTSADLAAEPEERLSGGGEAGCKVEDPAAPLSLALQGLAVRRSSQGGLLSSGRERPRSSLSQHILVGGAAGTEGSASPPARQSSASVGTSACPPEPFPAAPSSLLSTPSSVSLSSAVGPCTGSLTASPASAMPPPATGGSLPLPLPLSMPENIGGSLPLPLPQPPPPVLLLPLPMSVPDNVVRVEGRRHGGSAAVALAAAAAAAATPLTAPAAAAVTAADGDYEETPPPPCDEGAGPVNSRV